MQDTLNSVTVLISLSGLLLHGMNLLPILFSIFKFRFCCINVTSNSSGSLSKNKQGMVFKEKLLIAGFTHCKLFEGLYGLMYQAAFVQKIDEVQCIKCISWSTFYLLEEIYPLEKIIRSLNNLGQNTNHFNFMILGK